MSAKAGPPLAPADDAVVSNHLLRRSGKRKETLEELQRQKAHLDELFELAPEAIALSDVDARVLRINREFVNLFGYTPAEAVGRTLGELIVPDDMRDDFEKNKGRLLEGERVDVETVRRRRDGERLEVSLVAARVWLPGEKTGAYTIYRDITERKKAAHALRRSEEFLSQGERISRTGSWECHFGGPLTWSDEHFRIFGYAPGEVVPTLELFLERVHPDDRAFVARTIEESHQAGTGFSYDYRTVLADGSQKLLHGEALPFRDESGSITGFVGTTMDITERKRAEEDLRRKDADLHKAQSELAHVTRVTTMGELAASIAHEVNQPIAGMIINGDAALRWLKGIKGDSPNLVEAREALERIIRDGLRAGEIVTRVRRLFKKADPIKEPLDINDTIREVLVLTRNEMDKKRVRLDMRLADGLPRIQGDRVQLQQVLMNLILNAIEAMSAMEDRSRELIVGTETTEDSRVLVKVCDTGTGLDPSKTEKIFEAFHTTKPGGLGMGLSISRSIVESHSGRLWVVANEGPGVTFQFSLAASQS